MGAVATAAGTLDTDIANFKTHLAALVAAINSSQSTYFNAAATAGQYQQALTNFADAIRFSLLCDKQTADVLGQAPTSAANVALATQWANY